MGGVFVYVLGVVVVVVVVVVFVIVVVAEALAGLLKLSWFEPHSTHHR